MLQQGAETRSQLTRSETEPVLWQGAHYPTAGGEGVQGEPFAARFASHRPCFFAWRQWMPDIVSLCAVCVCVCVCVCVITHVDRKQL